MEYSGIISILSVPVGVLLVLISLSGKDTSGLAGIAVGAAVFVGALIAAIVGTISGAIALKSGTSSIPGTIGMVIGLIIVGMGVLNVLEFCVR